MAHAEQSAGAVRDREIAIRHLHLRMRFAAQLAHRLEDFGHAAAVDRVIAAKAAAVGVERQFADAGNQIAVGDELPPSPFLQKPMSSSCISTVMVKLS